MQRNEDLEPGITGNTQAIFRVPRRGQRKLRFEFHSGEQLLNEAVALREIDDEFSVLDLKLHFGFYLAA